jgi:hypothetical protein
MGETMQQVTRRSERLPHLRLRLLAGVCAAGFVATLGSEAWAQVPSTEPPAGHAQSAETSSTLLATPGVTFRGFGDLGWRLTSTDRMHHDFSLGQLNFFPSARLSPETSFLAELVLETNERNELVVDLERAVFGYHPLDAFNVRVGRYHTAIGYYNTAYHHSSWMQTTVSRPLLFAFEDEGGILAVHDVGVSVTGQGMTGGLRWEYTAEIGNGRTAHPNVGEPVQAAFDENTGKALGVSVSLRPQAMRGLRMGFSLRHDSLGARGEADASESVVAGHVVFKNDRVEILAEIASIRHVATDLGTALRTNGGYVQAARRYGDATPYARYEYLGAHEDDPFLVHAPRQHRTLAGVRWDVGDLVALKLELQRLNATGRSGSTAVQAHLSFGF